MIHYSRTAETTTAAAPAVKSHAGVLLDGNLVETVASNLNKQIYRHQIVFGVKQIFWSLSRYAESCTFPLFVVFCRCMAVLQDILTVQQKRLSRMIRKFCLRRKRFKSSIPSR